MTELHISTLVLHGVVTFVVALLGTFVMRQTARRCGLLSRPRADRWHREPVALHGGVGFYSAFFLSACFLLASSAASSWKGWDSISSLPSPLTLGGALVFGSLLMFGLGLWDDLCDLRPATKLSGQLIGASLFILAGGTFSLTGNPVLNQLVTYFWFIGIINAVNMLDNMDGLASGVVIISIVTLVLLTLGVADKAPAEYFGIQLGLMLAAAVAGFWVFNRSPASIFMGDSGSLSIGYLVAGLAVPSSLNGFLGLATTENVLSNLLALIIPAMALAIPIYDTTLVTLTRKWRAQPASQGGRDHSSHRLVCLGLTESTAVRLLYALSGLGGILALLMQRFPLAALPLGGVFLSALMISGVYLGRVKVLDATPAKEAPAWRLLASHLPFMRSTAELLLDSILIAACYYGAYLLRFEGQLSDETAQSMLHSLPLVVSSCLVANVLLSIYHPQWRTITMSDIPRYAGAVSGGSILSLAMVTLVTRFETGQSRSAYIIFGVLLMLTMVGARLSFRVLERLVSQQNVVTGVEAQAAVLIYGAGRGGKLVLDEPSSDGGASPPASEKSSNRTLLSSLERIPTSANPRAPEAR